MCLPEAAATHEEMSAADPVNLPFFAAKRRRLIRQPAADLSLVGVCAYRCMTHGAEPIARQIVIGRDGSRAVLYVGRKIADGTTKTLQASTHGTASILQCGDADRVTLLG